MKKLIKHIYIKIRYPGKVKMMSGSNVTLNSHFQGKNLIGVNSVFTGSMGFASYIGHNASVSGQVGKYCSIASEVRIINGFHPVRDYVSTHPALYSAKPYTSFSLVNQTTYVEQRYADDEKKAAVVIGNDVYVGYGAYIMAGVRIGNGAVIAAGSVVTQDVPDYAIVGGVPAKVIRYRFNREQIEFLENIRWWDKSTDWIKEHASSFENIEDFMRRCETSQSLNDE